MGEGARGEAESLISRTAECLCLRSQGTLPFAIARLILSGKHLDSPALGSITNPRDWELMSAGAVDARPRSLMKSVRAQELDSQSPAKEATPSAFLTSRNTGPHDCTGVPTSKESSAGPFAIMENVQEPF